MKELALSKLVNERKDVFPWLKIFLGKLVKKFPNDYDEEILQYLLQNVEEEINSLSKNEDAKTKEALFNTIYDLFLHFWWRIRWNGKKKWSRCWKIVSSEVSYVSDKRTKCCEKLLYYIIYLGIILSNGCPDSEWIGKVFKALHTLPSFDDMVYNSVLQVNNLEEKYHQVYLAILKHVLCSEVAENISEPVTYIKIIMLFRRLEAFTMDKIALSALKSTATSIKPPSETVQWLSSLEIDISLEKHKSVAKALLSKKLSNKVLHKLQQVITGTVTSEQEDKSLADVSEKMDKPKDTSHKKRHKHKRKSHRSHSMEKLKDSTASYNTEDTTAPVVTSTPFFSSKIKIKLNRKMLAGFNNSSKVKEFEHTEVLKKKKNYLKYGNISKKEFNEGLPIKVKDVNEFLNFSFAEISNFSKSVTPLPQETLSNENTSSSSNQKRKQTELCEVSLSDKRIKLNAKKDGSEIRSAQEKHLCNYESSKSDEIVCFNSAGTLNNISTNLLTENNSYTQEKIDSDDQWFVPSPSHSPDHFGISSSNLFNEETEIFEDNATKGQKVLLNKVPVVSLVDLKNIQTSALLKLVQPPDSHLVSNLHSNVSVSNNIENDTGKFDIDGKHLNTVIVTDELCDFIQKTDPAKLNNKVLHNTPILNHTGKFVSDISKAKISINKSPVALQETVNPKQNLPIGNLLINDLSQIECEKNTNSAIATNESSSLLSSTKNLNESIDRSGERLTNFEDPGLSSLRLSNSLTCSAPWVENSLITNDHRCDKGQSMIPATSQTLEFTQTNLNNSHNTQHSTFNSEIFHGSNSVNQRTDDRVCVTQNENTSHCVVDCKIVTDPNNSQNNESTSSIKVIINVTCKTPDDNSSRQKEHIFGNFDHKRTEPATPNTSENYFNSLNPFLLEGSTSEMPKLTPYYDDPPFLTKSIDAIATPPDSELDISVPSSLKRANIVSPKHLVTKKLMNKQACLLTPKNSSSALTKKLLNNNSDFRTPNTSDCESSNEWSLENTNLTNSLLLINSLQNSPVDNVLKQLNSRMGFTPDKKDTASAATLNSCSKKIVTYRCDEDIYSGDDFSDDSTISCVSHVSATDNELNSAFKKPVKPKIGKVDSQQEPNKVFQKKRKNPLPKKLPSNELQGVSCIANNRYNLRCRGKLHKPSKLDDFLTTQ